jgi:hypothetical protein
VVLDSSKKVSITFVLKSRILINDEHGQSYLLANKTELETFFLSCAKDNTGLSIRVD